MIEVALKTPAGVGWRGGERILHGQKPLTDGSASVIEVAPRNGARSLLMN